MKPQTVSLHVDDLVLPEIRGVDAEVFAASFQTELGRALLDEELHLRLGASLEVESLNAGALEHGADAGAEVLGAQTARAVARSLRAASRIHIRTGDSSVTPR